MYAMKEVLTSIFCVMMFPHKGKVITFDILMHYGPHPLSNLNSVLPLIQVFMSLSYYTEARPTIFKDFALFGVYCDLPPSPPSGSFCTNKT